MTRLKNEKKKEHEQGGLAEKRKPKRSKSKTENKQPTTYAPDNQWMMQTD